MPCNGSSPPSRHSAAEAWIEGVFHLLPGFLAEADPWMREAGFPAPGASPGGRRRPERSRPSGSVQQVPATISRDVVDRASATPTRPCPRRNSYPFSDQAVSRPRRRGCGPPPDIRNTDTALGQSKARCGGGGALLMGRRREARRPRGGVSAHTPPFANRVRWLPALWPRRPAICCSIGVEPVGASPALFRRGAEAQPQTAPGGGTESLPAPGHISWLGRGQRAGREEASTRGFRGAVALKAHG